ncbi:MAG TPA: class I SAM-dependent methyltransferase [Usitatibacter sp.]|nr:class I SAM-dependent methyltransferase [Usitatibacter sp.]
MRSLGLGEPLYAYVAAHAAREHPVLAELREATRGMRHAGMQIGPDQGAFMALLVTLLGARRTLEIGVFTGYSALAVALALPADGRIVACDVSEEWTAMARRHWEKAGVAHKIDLRLAPALQTLDGLLAAGEAQSFDFAFIDADKASYGAYYERCLALVRRGGLVAVDNTLWSGKVADPGVHDADTEAIRALNDAVHRDARVDMALLTVGDGLTLAMKR